MRARVIVSLKVEGVHHWPDCNIDEVKYLKDKHRHVFQIRMEFAVDQLNREIEIIQVQHRLREALLATFGGAARREPLDFGSMSCEQIAQWIMSAYCTTPIRRVEVLEDGENGALLEAE